MLIALHGTSNKERKELLKKLKPNTVKAICDCAINIINKRIKVTEEEKKKINRHRDKIRELVHPKTSQRRRKKLLVQHGGAFLAPLLAPVIGSLLGPLANIITGR